VEEDPLTGLLSRRGWEHALEQEVARAEADDSPFALTLALLDIDKMSEFNNAHGVEAGDLMLAELADKLRQTCRPTDCIARVGGEEFGVLLLGRSRPQVDALLSRLRVNLPAKPTCSVGVAHWHRSETAEQLVVRADEALYEAKRRRHD